MRLVMILVMLVTMIPTIMASYAQEVDYAHYVESIQVVVETDLEEVSAAVVLESVSIDDIRLPALLEEDLRTNERIIAVIFTDAESCILGVGDEACIIVNMARVAEETNIILIQDGAKKAADRFITLLNDALGVKTQFHSVFVHHSNEQNEALNVPEIIVGHNTVSVTYTAPQRGTSQFFEILASSLLKPDIYEGGGFVEAGRILASHPNSTVTFVAVPGNADTHMMLRVMQTGSIMLGETLDPLDILDVDEVSPSSYFDDGFYPLNSLVRLAVASKEGLAVSGTTADVIPMSNGKPQEVTRAGWFFDPPRGTLIRGTYIMGEDGKIQAGQTAMTLEWWDEHAPEAVGISANTNGEYNSMQNIVIVGVIVAAGAGAAVYYMRGYRRS